MTAQVRFLSILAAATLTAGSLAGAGRPEETPPTVSVAPAVKMDVPASKRYVGSIEAYEKVDIVPRITGNLLKINFKEGDFVRKGDLLFELEDTTYRANVEKSKALLAQIQSELAYSKIQFERNRNLRDKKAVSDSTFDDFERLFNTNTAKLAEAKAALIDAENTLSYTKIYAPISGRIGKTTATCGNLVTPNSGKLTDIEMTSPIYVRFALSERLFRQEFGGLKNIRKNSIVKIVLADGKTYHEKAAVTTINNKIDSKSNTITLWALFENKDDELIPGGFVTVLLTARSAKQPVGVLHSALVTDQNGTAVYLIGPENRAIRRPVQTGNCTDDYQEILQGIVPGDQVVVEGTHKLQPGMIVTPLPFKMEGK